MAAAAIVKTAVSAELLCRWILLSAVASTRTSSFYCFAWQTATTRAVYHPEGRRKSQFSEIKFNATKHSSRCVRKKHHDLRDLTTRDGDAVEADVVVRHRFAWRKYGAVLQVDIDVHRQPNEGG